MTVTDKEVMQMALDCLLSWKKEEIYGWGETDHKCVEALRAALAQPKKEWVGLTDEEIRNIATQGRTDFATLICVEAKLKKKNT